MKFVIHSKKKNSQVCLAKKSIFLMQMYSKTMPTKGMLKHIGYYIWVIISNKLMDNQCTQKLLILCIKKVFIQMIISLFALILCYINVWLIGTVVPHEFTHMAQSSLPLTTNLPASPIKKKKD